MRLLVIEDNRQLVANLFEYFEARGHVLDAAPDGLAGLHLATSHAYDALVVDWMLPRMDGPEMLRRLREQHHLETPAIMLTARDELPDKIAGFRAGADDYLTKPFGVPELLARMRVARRHRELQAAGQEQPSWSFGEIQVDHARRQVFVSGEETHLTPTEWRLLSVLLRNAGKVLTHRQLLHEAWGAAYMSQTQYLRVYMGQLRHKLEANPARPRYLLTEPGVGYRLAAE